LLEPLPAANPTGTINRFDISALLAQQQQRTYRDRLARAGLRVAVGVFSCGASLFVLFRDGSGGAWIAAFLGGFGVFAIGYTVFFWRRSQSPASGSLVVTGSYIQFEVPKLLPGVRMTWGDPSFALSIIDDHTIGATSANPRLPRGIYVGPAGRSGVPVPPEAYRLILELADLHGLTTSHRKIRNPTYLGGGETDMVSIRRP
jgi:hypothetical protein